MKIFQVGPDEIDYGLPSEEEMNGWSWIVYWYESGSYEGYGEAAGFHEETGMVYSVSLSHCSCYGPMDDGIEGLINGTKMSLEQILEDKDDIHAHDLMEEIKLKIREIMPSEKIFKDKFNFLE